MTELRTSAEVKLAHLPDYLITIVDRIASFDAAVKKTGQEIVFTFAFGTGYFDMHDTGVTVRAVATSAEHLARLKEILAGAIELYAKAESPDIVWTGDLAADTQLSSFRLLSVIENTELTPHMRRIRLSGTNLERFISMRGMHIRMLFPTPDVPEPVWPVAGANGLPFWPDEERRPVARVYTIRKIDVAEGWLDVDFVMHDDGAGHYPGVGAAWAATAQAGDRVGIIGPLGRPFRDAEWYVMGCDETGLPALGRILENLPPETAGVALIEIGSDAERQTLRHPTGVELRWIRRGDNHLALADAICAVDWPEDRETFGWFAAESESAAKVRDYWRGTLGYGRDQTLAAAYWKRGQSGLMAG